MAEDWLADVRKYVADADENVVKAIVRYCGIALQKRDSSLVSFSDAKETGRVRENFLKKKLGLTLSDTDLDAAIAKVGERMRGDTTKNRVTVYYLLTEHFGLLNIFGGAAGTAAGVAALAAGLGKDDDSASAAPVAGAALAGGGLAATAAGASSAEPIRASSPVEPAPMAPPPAAPPPVAPQTAYAPASDDGAGDGGGGLGWLKWLLLAAVLALLLFFILRSCSGEQTAPAGDATGTEATGGETAGPAALAPGTAATTNDAAATAAAIPQGAGVVAGERNGKPMLTVYFDSGKSDVSNDLATAAAGVRDYVAKNAGSKLAVSGYNDPTGNAALNAELSKRRAQGVARALEAAGIPASAIELVKPEAATDTAVDKAAARRVEVTVQ